MLAVIALFFIFSFKIHAQTPPQAPKFVAPKEYYYRGVVVKVVEEGEKEVFGQKNFYQNLIVKVLSGPEKDRNLPVVNGGAFKLTKGQMLTPGDQVVLLKSVSPKATNYAIVDRYRITFIYYLVAGFFLFIIGIAWLRGLGSIVGMIISLATILWFIIPQILAGRDPLLITIAGSLFIMIVTIYLAHGFSKRTSIAVISTFISLVVTGLLAYLFVALGSLTGLGDENAYILQLGYQDLNLKGLLLGGIIIGTLGVLDDVTTGLSATIFELHDANKNLGFARLVGKGLIIGREHVASLVNTLVLAYAGTSLGLFILFVINPTKQPLWVILNTEVVTQEIVRTIAGSTGLILAVPLTTLIASWYVTKKRS